MPPNPPAYTGDLSQQGCSLLAVSQDTHSFLPFQFPTEISRAT